LNKAYQDLSVHRILTRQEVSNHQHRVGQLDRLSVAGTIYKLLSAHAEVFSTFIIENVSRDIGEEVRK
jgi:hypothetical protein